MKTTLLLSLLLAGAAFAETTEPYSWRGRVDPGKTFELRGVNGSIHAELSSSSDVEVTAVKRGDKQSPSTVRVDVVPGANGITMCAIYPSSGGRENTCKSGGGHQNVRDNDVKVDFTVKVPAGVTLSANNVNGGIQIDNLKSDVKAHTVNGRVKVAASGVVSASTVNGSIEAVMGSAEWTGKNSFETVNGTIDVALPASVSTDIEASTVNGSISSDLPITLNGKISRRELKGRIGSGGRSLELETVNGSIKLRRS